MLISEALGTAPITCEEPQERRDGLINSSALLGFEFEFERCGRSAGEILHHPTYRELTQYFSAHADGSLRGNDAVEFVFQRPLPPWKAYDALQSILNFAGAFRWAVNRRTGLHIHVNVSDMEIEHWGNLLQLYCLYEPAIYTAIEDQRSGSIFCIPWFRDLAIASSVAMCMSGAGGLHFSRTFGKYSGLNIRPLAELGSIEFRHMRNTLDGQKIKNWMNFILVMYETAKRPDFAGLYADILSGNYRRGLEIMYEPHGIRPWAGLLYPQLETELTMLTLDNAHELNWNQSKYLAEVRKKKKKVVSETRPQATRTVPTPRPVRNRVFNMNMDTNMVMGDTTQFVAWGPATTARAVDFNVDTGNLEQEVTTLRELLDEEENQ